MAAMLKFCVARVNFLKGGYRVFGAYIMIWKILLKYAVISSTNNISS